MKVVETHGRNCVNQSYEFRILDAAGKDDPPEFSEFTDESHLLATHARLGILYRQS